MPPLCGSDSLRPERGLTPTPNVMSPLRGCSVASQHFTSCRRCVVAGSRFTQCLGCFVAGLVALAGSITAWALEYINAPKQNNPSLAATRRDEVRRGRKPPSFGNYELSRRAATQDSRRPAPQVRPSFGLTLAAGVTRATWLLQAAHVTKVQYRRLYFRNLDEPCVRVTLVSWA